MSEAMKFFSGKMIKTIVSRRAATSRERSEIDRGGHWRFFPFLLAPKPNRARVQRSTFILWLGGIARPRSRALGGLVPWGGYLQNGSRMSLKVIGGPHEARFLLQYARITHR